MEDNRPLDEKLDSDLQTVITRPAIEQIEGVLYADGFEDCLVGHGNIFHGSDGPVVVAIYDRTKIMQKLADDFVATCDVNNPGDTHEECYHLEEADEYIGFNMEGAFIKTGMPVYASFQADTINIETMYSGCACGGKCGCND